MWSCFAGEWKACWQTTWWNLSPGFSMYGTPSASWALPAWSISTLTMWDSPKQSRCSGLSKRQCQNHRLWIREDETTLTFGFEMSRCDATECLVCRMKLTYRFNLVHFWCQVLMKSQHKWLLTPVLQKFRCEVSLPFPLVVDGGQLDKFDCCFLGTQITVILFLCLWIYVMVFRISQGWSFGWNVVSQTSYNRRLFLLFAFFATVWLQSKCAWWMKLSSCWSLVGFFMDEVCRYYLIGQPAWC